MLPAEVGLALVRIREELVDSREELGPGFEAGPPHGATRVQAEEQGEGHVEQDVLRVVVGDGLCRVSPGG